MLDNIESNQKESAEFQVKLDRLQELAEKQKKIIDDQERIIEEQKQKISKMYDVPEDIRELKELIGTQRALLTKRETELEVAKGEALQAQRELELLKKTNMPAQERLESMYETTGNLKAELAEKNSQLLLKDEKIMTLENQIKEIQAFADRLQEEQVKLMAEMDQKWKNEIEHLQNDYLEEKKDLVSKITELDQFLLDSKLTSTEASSDAKDMKSALTEIRKKHEDLIKKVEELRDKNREANELNSKLNDEMSSLKTFKHENQNKIDYYDKLTKLMEQEVQFKAFLILEKVGSMHLEDLRNALGSPIVLVRKIVQKLQEADLVFINEEEKISVKKIELE